MGFTVRNLVMGAITLAALGLAGCGGGGGGSSSNTAGDTVRTLVPPEGGTVPISAGSDLADTAIFGSLVFKPGAPPGTEISVTESLTPPARATLPRTDPATANSTAESFLFVTLRTSQDLPADLIDEVLLQGDIPTEQERYHADLVDLEQGRFLEVMPGQYQGGLATFDEVAGDTVLEANRPYTMRFTGVNEKTLPLKVANDSGVNPCYVFITGRNPDLTKNDPYFYRVTSDGQFVPMKIQDLDPQTHIADYNIPVPADGMLKIPQMAAGRVYVTLGEKIKTQLNPGTGNDPPALWVAPTGWSNPNEPNYLTLFDWIEFDYKISPDTGLPGMGINKTEVQMVCLPFTIALSGLNETTGAPETRTVGAKAGARQNIFDTIGQDPTFKSLIVHGTANGTNVSPIRVVSPDNGIYNTQNNIPNTPTFPLDYYDAYIDQVWQKYLSEDLAMVTSAYGTYVGRVNTLDQMVFTQQGKRSITIPKPSSSDVIIGNGALIADVPNAPTEEEKNIVREHAATMSACFNRTTLLRFPRMLRTFPANGLQDPDFVSFLNSFYADSPTNVYSKVIHANSLPTAHAPNGGAYGFGFDDNLDQSSFVAFNNDPTGLVLTIARFQSP